VSAFGPAPIPPNPNAVQASFIAQHAAGARPRDKAKTREADSPRRVTVQDEVRLSDPAEAQEVEPKPDEAEEWKHRRTPHLHRDGRRDPSPGDDRPSLDIKA